MLEEIKDFFLFEKQFGIRVLLYDLFTIHMAFRQDTYLRDILNFAKEKNLKFTFFFSAKNIDKRIVLINEILSEGHEIASHGFNHILLGKLSYKKLKTEFELAQKKFGKYEIKVRGFRPPFLNFNYEFMDLLKTFKYEYISSKIGGKFSSYKNGIYEVPIIKPYDWQGLVVERKNIDTLIKSWKNKDGCCYLFHPWIIHKYFDKIIPLFGENKDYRIYSNLKTGKISVSFDVY